MCAIFQLDINIPAVPPGFCDGGNERRIKQILIKKRQIFVGRTCNFARLPQVWAKTRHDDAHSHLRYTRSQRGRGGGPPRIPEGGPPRIPVRIGPVVPRQSDRRCKIRSDTWSLALD